MGLRLHPFVVPELLVETTAANGARQRRPCTPVKAGAVGSDVGKHHSLGGDHASGVGGRRRLSAVVMSALRPGRPACFQRLRRGHPRNLASRCRWCRSRPPRRPSLPLGNGRRCGTERAGGLGIEPLGRLGQEVRVSLTGAEPGPGRETHALADGFERRDTDLRPLFGRADVDQHRRWIVGQKLVGVGNTDLGERAWRALGWRPSI